MRNALLPPVSSHLYNFGNNEVQMPNLDVSMPMDGKMNVHGTTSFYLDSKVFIDDHQQRDGGFSIPRQSLVSYQPVAGYQSISSTFNNISQQSMLPSKRVSVPEVQMDFQAMQMKKRTINELTNLLPQRGPSDLVENKTALSTWKTNKRKKANSPGELWNHQAMESINIQEQKVPVRRSQKLSDKITALQKLVSPYGKTDTASVLQEASLYIKLLQEQIQNLIQMLTSSYSRARPIQQSQEIDGRLVDLRSRGLCFVPISFMQKMTQQQDHVDPSSYPRKTISARTF